MSGRNSDTGAASVKTGTLDASATALLAAARPAISDLTRAQIVWALFDGPFDVSDLTRLIGRRRTVVSQHLRVLREAGLVEAQRQGRRVLYRLTNAPAVRVARTAIEAAARAAQ